MRKKYQTSILFPAILKTDFPILLKVIIKKELKILTIKGILSDTGKIEFETEKTVYWNDLTDEPLPNLPFGSSLYITISFDEDEFISGKDGIVWATYFSRQAEIIRNALLALQINSEIHEIQSSNETMLLIKVTSKKEINDAVDFIWRGSSGLRLKPDWSYAEGETNKSFELWLSGH